MIEKTTSGGTGLALDQLPELAAQAGVNKSKFSSCLDSGRHQQKILAQQAAGQATGVNGTPGNIIYNNVTKESRVIPGAVALSTMTAAIDAMLGK
jgi:protein-disulfide isomerase